MSSTPEEVLAQVREHLHAARAAIESLSTIGQRPIHIELALADEGARHDG